MPSPENFPGPDRQEQRIELLDLPIDLTEIKEADYDPETFKQTLIAKRQEIIDRIERQYEKSLEQFPGYDDIRLPGATVAVLTHSAGKKWSKVIEPEAYWNKPGTGIFLEKEDIKPKYHSFWVAVVESGFVPEVRMEAVWGGHGQANLNAKLPEHSV